MYFASCSCIWLLCDLSANYFFRFSKIGTKKRIKTGRYIRETLMCLRLFQKERQISHNHQKNCAFFVRFTRMISLKTLFCIFSSVFKIWFILTEKVSVETFSVINECLKLRSKVWSLFKVRWATVSFKWFRSCQETLESKIFKHSNLFKFA